MTTPTQYRSWFSFLFVCGIALLISCSDNGGGSQQSSIEITRISPDSGAVGSQVQIYSSAIDPEHAKNQIEIDGTPVPILSYGSNKLVVEIPEGISSGPVTLRVNGKVANGPYFKVLTEGPVIEAITPGQGGPGTQVTITGDHFLPPAMMAKISGDSTARGATTSATDDSLQSDAPNVTLKAKGEPSPTINELPVSVSFGDKLAPLLSLSATEIIVEVPEGATGGPITLSVGEQTVTSNDFRLFLQPVINKVSPTAGPAGTPVTITGHYFSLDPDSNQVRFNSTEAEITQADSTQLVATVPDGVTTGPVEVITRGQATTGPTFTVSEAPVPQVSIADLNPKQGPVGTTVTIDGQNFSSTNAENIVMFNGTQATISSATETELVATLPQGTTNGPVKVETNGQTATGPSFTVTADPDKQLTIGDISPKEGPVGTSVTITGANFSGTASENTVSFNGTQATVNSASTTELSATVPKEATSGAVKVEVGSQTAEGPTFTVTDAPVPQVTISDISPKQGTVGTEVTITGENFDGTKSDNTVSFNGTEATISSASETKLIVNVPEGATTGTVDVTVGDQTATGPTFTVTEEPVPQVTIEGINPKEGPVGTPVTITGQNFSATASENTVTFNGTEATITSASETVLEVTVPQGATNGPVKVETNGQTATGPNFSITADPDKQLTITSLSPKEGPVGTRVVITGTNFSGTAADNTVSFNGTSATVQEASTTELTVSVPEGATTGTVNVTVGDQTATGPTFTVTETPVPQVTIEGINPKEGPVGSEVTITGQNFSGTTSENIVTFNGTQATISSATETELVATLPQGTTNGPVKVETNGQTATGPSFTVTADPDKELTITGINPKEGPVGSEVIISGENFSAAASDNTVSFNGTEATVNSTSTTELAATVPDGTTSGPVTVQVGEQTATGPTFTVTENHAPTITSTSFTVDENTRDVATITATDPEGDDLTFTLSGGADRDAFSISESGELAFEGAPDFEIPGDTDTDNTYEVTVQVSDGSLTDSQDIAVDVRNVNDNPPAFSRGRIRTNDSETYFADDPDFTFDVVPAGTDLSTVAEFHIKMEEDVDPTESASISGPFTIQSISPDGHTIYLSGPILEQSESPYEFTVTAQNEAGQTPQMFTIRVQPFEGGSGTANDPYQVENVEQLQNVGQYVGEHFEQTADIDASATAGWDGGKGFDRIAGFTGTYDGDGYTISKLTIDRPNTNHIGLFGAVNGGVIKNVHLRDVDITGHRWVGGLAGQINTTSTTTGSSVTGDVSGNEGVGGLVGGTQDGGTITRSYSTADVTGSYRYTGGLVGYFHIGSSIKNSYATGDVSGNDDVGGLVGSAGGSIKTSYAVGGVSGNDDVGGLVGSAGNVSSVTDSYWDWDSNGTGQANSAGGGKGMTTSKMQGTAAKDNMEGFDFDEVWQVQTDPTDDYPTLQQNNPEE